ncbi:unnamed protein product [Moneuplotes crassus]|uniref:Uncharacterized protein n=1 Tax=Euplotes crassus TaxID=5936 RepID=A0AAD1XY13_EUPCR|nr:unnamed protein product [Moneuplotes crassus]
MLGRVAHKYVRRGFIVKNKLRLGQKNNRVNNASLTHDLGEKLGFKLASNSNKNYRVYPFFYILSFFILRKYIKGVYHLIIDVKDFIESAPKDIQDKFDFMKFYQGETNIYSKLTNEQLEALNKHSEILITRTEVILDRKIMLFMPVAFCGLLLHLNYFNIKGWRVLPVVTFSLCFLVSSFISFLIHKKRPDVLEILDECKRVNEETNEVKRGRNLP